MLTRPLVALLCILPIAACSAKTDNVNPTGASSQPPAASDTTGATDPQEPAPPSTPDYPAGPYGNAVGQTLGNLELVGYLRTETTGLASANTRGAVTLSDVRAQAGSAAYALIHVSAFWCGICRGAVQELVSAYPEIASKAVFVDLLVEGESPEDTTTDANVDAWVRGLRIPYTVARDPDGIDFRIRSQVGKNKTAVLVELATMTVIAKSASDYRPVLEALRSAP